MKHDYSTLLHFLRTGELEDLKLGMTQDSVLAYLGEPDSQAMAERRSRIILKYGCLWLHFVSALVEIEIRINQYPEYALPSPLSNELLINMQRLELRPFITFLQTHQIEYDESYKYVLVFMSGSVILEVFFSEEDDRTIAMNLY